MATRRIDSLESFDVDGSTQWLLLRGDPSSQRVLLIIQSLLWFEVSAHMPQYEEPALFREALRRALVHGQGKGVQHQDAKVSLVPLR
jgi:hypothetical protein